MKGKMLALLTAILVVLGVLAMALHAHSSSSEVVAIEIQNSTGARILVKALYPDGFREIQPLSIKGGTVYLDVSGLRRAWSEAVKKRSYGGEPFIVLTIVRGCEVAVHGFPLDEKARSSKITIVPRYRRLLQVNASPGQSGTSSCTSGSDDVSEVLEESKEMTIPAVVAEVRNFDNTSWGQVTWSYSQNARVGFGVYVFLNGELMRVGTVYLYSPHGGSVSHAAFGRGEGVYVWMNFTYRCERWSVHVSGGNFYEEYVFVKGFEPASLSWGHERPPNVMPAPVSSWKLAGGYTSDTITYPYYQFSLNELPSDYFSIDASGFVSVLSPEGAIPDVWPGNFSIDVRYKSDNMSAFTFTLDLYGESGSRHLVFEGLSESKETDQGVPLVAFRIEG
ncbi:hypothetical protein [Thermococcus sp. AM4]|uniref:hypothetical protein n=1 Tax=Thermococcus sp. (strain AM4) TaxID=246969 RepID=UPI00018710DF|nr:hypothetical protein [Thermococcus sp. AM4]EEB74191.1 conserved hypothetical protein [Thermococcus sp. AM4]